jgi:hypothetical protein
MQGASTRLDTRKRKEWLRELQSLLHEQGDVLVELAASSPLPHRLTPASAVHGPNRSCDEGRTVGRNTLAP